MYENKNHEDNMSIVINKDHKNTSSACFNSNQSNNDGFLDLNAYIEKNYDKHGHFKTPATAADDGEDLTQRNIVGVKSADSLELLKIDNLMRIFRGIPKLVPFKLTNS